MLIVVRTEGGSHVGYGHIYRCISLVRAMQVELEYINILFVINNQCASLLDELGFDYVVSDNFDINYDLDILKDKSVDLILFDSYNGTDIYLSKLKSISKLVIFDDNNDLYSLDNVDVVINGNVHGATLGYDTSKSTSFLLGTKHLVMKEEYWNNDTSFIDKKGILITTGGTDTYNLTYSFMKNLQKINIPIVVIVGPGFSNEQINVLEKEKCKNVELIIKPNSLKKYLSKSKYVVTASGSSVYEVLTQKSIPILFSQAKNQNLAYYEFEKANVKTIGIYPEINFDKAYNYIKSFEESDISNTKIEIDIDGKGAYRVAKYLKNYLVGGNIE